MYNCIYISTYKSTYICTELSGCLPKNTSSLGFFFPLKEMERLFGANRVGSIWNGGASEEKYKEAYKRGDIIDD